MKIAIISDIHGNLEALKTTLKDIKSKNVDKIFCLGDIIGKGVHAKECLEIVKDSCEIILQGNCDDFFSKSHPDFELMSQIEQARVKWNHSLITDKDREYLLNLPFSYEFYMSGSLVRMFHATPVDSYKTIINQNSIEEKYQMFLPSEYTCSDKIADVVIYGHTHHAYMDKIYNKTLINVGSVGNEFDPIRNPKKDSSPMETTRSYYLILEGKIDSQEYDSDISFQFVRVPYDIHKELEAEYLNIEKDIYRYELTNGMYRDMELINNNFKRLGIDVDKI